MFNIKKKKKGLTLIETLISLVILCFIITPILMIVSSSRNLNKDGEVTQKNIYILQKYAEKFKEKDLSSANLTNNESFTQETFTENGQQKERMTKIFTPKDSNTSNQDIDIPSGYKVKVNIEALDDYKFADTASSTTSTSTNTGGSSNTSTSNSGYSSIKYDAKINIIKHVDTTGNIGTQAADLFVENKDGQKQGNTYPVNNNYILEVINGEDNNGSVVDGLIINLKDGTSENPIKTWIFESTDKNQINDASVIVQVDSNEDNSSNVSLTVNCYNKINSSNDYLYLVSSKDISVGGSSGIVNTSVSVKQGTVYVTDGIYKRTDSSNTNQASDYDNTTRLYKIVLSLYKDNQTPEVDKPVQQVTTYKTVSK